MTSWVACWVSRRMAAGSIRWRPTRRPPRSAVPFSISPAHVGGWIRVKSRRTWPGCGRSIATCSRRPAACQSPGEAYDGAFINHPDTDLADPALNTSGVPWHTLYYRDNTRGCSGSRHSGTRAMCSGTHCRFAHPTDAGISAGACCVLTHSDADAKIGGTVRGGRSISSHSRFLPRSPSHAPFRFADRRDRYCRSYPRGVVRRRRPVTTSPDRGAQALVR